MCVVQLVYKSDRKIVFGICGSEMGDYLCFHNWTYALLLEAKENKFQLNAEQSCK